MLSNSLQSFPPIYPGSGSERRSSTGARRGAFQRFLLTLVSHEKENRRSTPYLGPQSPQPLFSGSIFQNKNTSIHHANYAAQRLDVRNRLSGCISPCPHTSSISEVPQVCGCGLPLAVRLSVFGITSAPRTFTKVLLPLIALLREKGLRVSHYLDNIILLAHSRQTMLMHQELLVTTLQMFGWVINLPKSRLLPSQRMVFLGALLGTVRNSVSLPQDKMISIQARVRQFLAFNHHRSRDHPLFHHTYGEVGTL